MINWAHVASLRNDIGEDAFDEVIEIFLEDVEAELDALAGDVEPAQTEARLHLLKGSALNLGFTAFAERCAEGEKAAGQGERVDIAPLPELYRTSKAAFLEGLKRRLAS